MEYLDFEIEIRTDESGRHEAVVQSSQGEARGPFQLDLNPLQLENRLQALEIALLRGGTTRRRVASGDELTVQGFGRELFGALFRDDILSKYDGSRQEARRLEKGLRIRLRFESADLALLPWEYLYDPRDADYLSRSIKTPLVRYLELHHPIEPLKVKPPLRVLGLVSSPNDLDPLDVDRERRRVEDALAPLRDGGRLELTWLQSPTWEALLRALQHPGSRWHIFHFVGHGGFDADADEGLIVLTDEIGRSHRLPASQLAALLGDHDPMRLAVLNSCEGARGGSGDIFSSTAASILRKGTPAVVAMQYEISDTAAINFSRTFYAAVADGLPVDAAVSQARKGIWLAEPSSLEWGTPVLHMRARDGLLFTIDQAATPADAIPPVSDLPPAPAEVAPASAPVAETPPVAAVPPGLVTAAASAPPRVEPQADAPAPGPEPAATGPESGAVRRPSARTFCVSCGTRLVPGNRFCNGCGRPVT